MFFLGGMMVGIIGDLGGGFFGWYCRGVIGDLGSGFFCDMLPVRCRFAMDELRQKKGGDSFDFVHNFSGKKNKMRTHFAYESDFMMFLKLIHSCVDNF